MDRKGNPSPMSSEEWKSTLICKHLMDRERAQKGTRVVGMAAREDNES